MGFLEQLLGKSEYKTCEMGVNFTQDESDVESGHIVAEIYGEEIIGWNKYIHTLCAFKDDSVYSDNVFAYVDMIKEANQRSELTIPVLFQLKGGVIKDIRVDFATYSRRIEDERFADLEVRFHHILNIKRYKK
ncbi:hypothetical protein [Oribacterium sp. WCC10]|uniref:hypothetical protein n=1 Tax=Oribacterium sp. WCC10 TaxID=1855343 RepID=UPI0008EA56AF|nr:hypothetical protein [Oribacterium sp. WCC10]SFG63734.1 hypothetical protein SAMN05216356_11638 [Oribacterium sp. WCC10]